MFLTRQAWQVLNAAEELYLRTGDHPITDHLPERATIKTFDDLYQSEDDFESVYQGIVTQLLELAKQPGGVTYAVPGDPTVGEATVSALSNAAKANGLSVELIHGISFVEPCLEALGLDALDGLYIGDALDLARRNHPPFPPDTPALIGQVYSSMLASDVKLTLMNQYPDDHKVVLLHNISSQDAVRESVYLHQIDRSQIIGNMTTLYLPPLSAQSAFENFQETVAHLRAPNGCPWDRQQTHESLRTHLLQESYEALQAIDVGDMLALREELGDLLLQIVLQAQIATEQGDFSMAEVIAGIQAKIIRRHPHVFGDLEMADVEGVLHNWEALKAAEREGEGEQKGLLDGIPVGLPALTQAAEIQDRVRRVGFDWPEIEGVLAKIQEELHEVQQAEELETRSDEIGDLLFAVVNYARWLSIDPEAALREANQRFRQRFRALEEGAKDEGRSLSEMTLEEMDDLWEAAKGG
jgi:tetrapyrrole methylase family protein/MazG family protein